MLLHILWFIYFYILQFQTSIVKSNDLLEWITFVRILSMLMNLNVRKCLNWGEIVHVCD